MNLVKPVLYSFQAADGADEEGEWCWGVAVEKTELGSPFAVGLEEKGELSVWIGTVEEEVGVEEGTELCCGIADEFVERTELDFGNSDELDERIELGCGIADEFVERTEPGWGIVDELLEERSEPGWGSALEAAAEFAVWVPASPSTIFCCIFLIL